MNKMARVWTALILGMTTAAMGCASDLDDPTGDEAAASVDTEGTVASAVTTRNCATVEPSDTAKASIEDEMNTITSGMDVSAAVGATTIDVYVHVINKGSGLSNGDVPDTQINQQITVLNQNFSGTGFRFTLAGVDYTNNATWFRDLDSNTSAERAAKAATHAGDANDLNIWTTNGPSYLGFATFPSWYKRSPQLDGIVLDYQSFPGGAYGTQFSLGKTATHEVGHWLGLLHTFQGACNAKGDYVDDTPAEATPTSGCPEGKDTCTAPGLDPIHNYMDYSYDSCYTMFSAGQIQRMHDQFAYFRADGGTSVGN